MKNIIKKTILSTGLLSGGMLFAQVVGINTTTPQSTLEVNHKQESRSDYLLKVQDQSKTLDIFNIKTNGTQAGLGKTSDSQGFGNNPVIFTLHSKGNRDRLKIEVPTATETALSTILFKSTAGNAGEIGYKKLNNEAVMILSGQKTQIGVNEKNGVFANVDKIVFRSTEQGDISKSTQPETQVDENGNWIFGVFSPTEKKEKLNLSKGLNIKTTHYTNISHNATTPVPKGGAGTIVFQQSDKKLYGFNGKKWKLLSNE